MSTFFKFKELTISFLEPNNIYIKFLFLINSWAHTSEAHWLYHYHNQGE